MKSTSSDEPRKVFKSKVFFYKSDIKKVCVLKEGMGSYGRFLDPYGELEEWTVADGLDSIRDGLYSEEPEHVLRLLRCLRAHLNAPDDALDRPARLARCASLAARTRAFKRSPGSFGSALPTALFEPLTRLAKQKNAP